MLSVIIIEPFTLYAIIDDIFRKQIHSENNKLKKVMDKNDWQTKDQWVVCVEDTAVICRLVEEKVCLWSCFSAGLFVSMNVYIVVVIIIVSVCLLLTNRFISLFKNLACEKKLFIWNSVPELRSRWWSVGIKQAQFSQTDMGEKSFTYSLSLLFCFVFGWSKTFC